MRVAMEILVNDLAGAGRGVTIVLDDYHLIDSDPIHEAVAFLLERLPENARLVIAGRTDPPLPLPKLRARDQVTELRAADLRFTLDEAVAFLNGVMELALSEGRSQHLERSPKGGLPRFSSRRSPCATARTSRISSSLSPGATATCWTSWPKRSSGDRPKG